MLMSIRTSCVMRKPDFNFAYMKTKAQMCCDSAFVFCYTDSTIPLLPVSEISSSQSSVGAQAGLCQTWSKTWRTCFLASRSDYMYIQHPLLFGSCHLQMRKN